MVSIRLMVRRMCRPPLLLLRRTKRSIIHQSANFQDVCLLLASLKGDIDTSHMPMLAFSWPRSKKGSWAPVGTLWTSWSDSARPQGHWGNSGSPSRRRGCSHWSDEQGLTRWPTSGRASEAWDCMPTVMRSGSWSAN